MSVSNKKKIQVQVICVREKPRQAVSMEPANRKAGTAQSETIHRDRSSNIEVTWKGKNKKEVPEKKLERVLNRPCPLAAEDCQESSASAKPSAPVLPPLTHFEIANTSFGPMLDSPVSSVLSPSLSSQGGLVSPRSGMDSFQLPSAAVACPQQLLVSTRSLLKRRCSGNRSSSSNHKTSSLPRLVVSPPLQKQTSRSTTNGSTPDSAEVLTSVFHPPAFPSPTKAMDLTSPAKKGAKIREQPPTEQEQEDKSAAVVEVKFRKDKKGFFPVIPIRGKKNKSKEQEEVTPGQLSDDNSREQSASPQRQSHTNNPETEEGSGSPKTFSRTQTPHRLNGELTQFASPFRMEARRASVQRLLLGNGDGNNASPCAPVGADLRRRRSSVRIVEPSDERAEGSTPKEGLVSPSSSGGKKRKGSGSSALLALGAPTLSSPRTNSGSQDSPATSPSSYMQLNSSWGSLGSGKESSYLYFKVEVPPHSDLTAANVQQLAKCGSVCSSTKSLHSKKRNSFWKSDCGTPIYSSFAGSSSGCSNHGSPVSPAHATSSSSNRAPRRNALGYQRNNQMPLAQAVRQRNQL